MATIRDVAREAGASISTVSKALNGSNLISKERADHIKAVAKEMGYRPNARAQAFAKKAARTIIFLARLDKNVAFENPHMFEILTGVAASLRAKNYGLTLQHCDTKETVAIAKDVISSKSADGLIIHASVVSRELSVLLSREKLPHIVIGKPDFLNSLCWIDNSNRLAGEIAAKRLLDFGHKKIALICSYKYDNISEDRLSGARTELSTLETVHILRGESTIEEGERMGLELLNLSEHTTGVICTNNHLAVGCLRAFSPHHIRVPEDISTITFDEYPLAKFTDPPLTTVNIDVYELGIQAGKLLLSKVSQPSLRVQSYSTLPVLVDRQSVKSWL